MQNHSVRVDEAGLAILSLEPRVAFKHSVGVISGSKRAQHMSDGKPATADDGFAAKVS